MMRRLALLTACSLVACGPSPRPPESSAGGTSTTSGASSSSPSTSASFGAPPSASQGSSDTTASSTKSGDPATLHARATTAFTQCTTEMAQVRDNRPLPAGVDLTRDCMAATSALDASCAAGSKPDCENAKSAKKLAAILPLLHQTQVASACAAHSTTECQASCDGGDLDACVEIAQMAFEGRRMPKDAAKSARLLTGACAKGSIRACYMHGAYNMMLDPTAAAPSLNIACASDNQPWNDVSCGLLANMIDRGSYAPSRDAQQKLWKKVCDRNRASGNPTSANACGRLADLGGQ